MDIKDISDLHLTPEDLKDPDIRYAYDTFNEALKAEKRQRCRDDVFFLANEILGFKELVPDDFNHPYKQIDLMLDRKAEYGYNKLFNLILVPRGCLKSSLITIAKTIQRILRNGDVRILITSAVLKQSIDFLSTIKQHLSENPKMVDLFGNLKGRIWRENEITVAHRRSREKEKTIEVGSPEHTLTGKHYDFIIADDLVTRANILTAESCYATYLYFKDLLDLLDHTTGAIDIVGTRWSFSDMYGQILDEKNGHLPYFNTYVCGCFNEDGSAKFPKKLSLEHIKALQENKADDLEFSAQYLNDPVPAKDATFKVEYFKNYFEPDKEPDNLPAYILCDPAATKNKKSDYTAIMVIKVRPNGDWLIWDIVNDKLLPGALENKLWELYKKYKPVKFCVEQVGFAAYVGKDLKTKMDKEKEWFVVTELLPKGRSKDDRIRSLEAMFMYKKIFFPKHGIKYVNADHREMDMVFALRDELLKFPATNKKDLADVLAYGRDVIQFVDMSSTIEKTYGGDSKLMASEFEHRKQAYEAAEAIGEDSAWADEDYA